MANSGVIYVDPNTLPGHDPTTNIFKSNEELSILVDLETSTRSRSVVTIVGDKVDINNTDGGVISFFRGNQVNKEGSTSYTTRYTDLTTQVGVNLNEKDYESLGITNILIDFNSSYAPIITINFVDVRGRSLLQQGNDSPYNVLFQLPYPIFRLTIKGFYGQSVTYCLHLTKFTSRFNSQNGNFEITTNFIGYTYALLSDMLIGYLRAIPRTKLGHDKFQALKIGNDANLLTIDELIVKTGTLNANLKNLIKGTRAAQIETAKLKLKEIDTLKDAVNKLFEQLSNSTEIKNGDIIVNNYRIVFKLPSDVKQLDDFKKNKDGIVNIYLENVKTLLLNYNDNNDEQFRIDIKQLEPIIYKNITRNELIAKPNNISTISKLKVGTNKIENVPSIRDGLIITLSTVDDFQLTYIYDLTSLYSILEERKNNITLYDKQNKVEVANRLKVEFSDTDKGLGMEPTIRNFFKVLTTQVEIFLDCIYDVSKKAGPDNIDRTNELNKLFVGKQLDVKVGDTIWPWPEYREINATNGNVLEETWIGDKIINKTKVPEVDFVEDLIRVMVEGELEVEKALENVDIAQGSWSPINPFDTKIFTNNPYLNIRESTNIHDIFKVMLFRAVTYLNLTNNSGDLSKDELITIAKLEANNVFNVVDKKLINGANGFYSVNDPIIFFSGVHDEIKNAEGNTGFFSDITIDVNNPSLLYNYIIFNDTDPSVNRYYIPIDGKFNSFNGDIFYNNKIPKTNEDLFSDNNINGTTPSLYLGNFTGFKSGLGLKPNDGATYLKIIDSSTFEEQLRKASTIGSDGKDIITDTIKNSSSIIVEGSQFPKDLFGGLYGIQEYSKIQYNSELGEQDMFTYFYFNTLESLGSEPEFLSTNLANPSIKKELTNFDIDNKDKFNVRLTSAHIHSAIKTSYTEIGKNRNLLAVDNFYIPNIDFCVQKFNTNNSSQHSKYTISLFGSMFYYGQKSLEAKAFLFLHTFPWTGLFDAPADKFGNQTSIFDDKIINKLFSERASFIQVPKLWAAFIGAILWRLVPNNDNSDKIIFKNDEQSFIPEYNNNFPGLNQFLTSDSIGIFSNIAPTPSPLKFVTDGKYKSVDNVLKNLPQQVKDEFIQIFDDFVNNEWVDIKNALEIIDVKIDGDLIQWERKWGDFISELTLDSAILNTDNDVNIDPLVVSINKNKFNELGFKNNGGDGISNYRIISPLKDYFFIGFNENINGEKFRDINNISNESSPLRYNYILELKPDTDIMGVLNNLVKEKVYIANGTSRIWKDVINSSNKIHDDIVIRKNDLQIYVNAFKQELINLNSVKNSSADEDRVKQKIFGSMDNKNIKLNVYRTLKSIYDKWIGGSEDSNIIFQCGSRNQFDVDQATKNGRNKPNLIDSFRFVSRSFSDLSDKFFINPIYFAKTIEGSRNQSFYDVTGRILADNNFDFIPLPAYIDYRNEKQLETMFNTYNYRQGINEGVGGPSFVCVYVGQTSNKLDLGSKSSHENDGFDIPTNVPSDFENVPVFAVNYGQQNQNIFKDIKLDQAEFTETEESLQIIDDIAHKGSPSNQTYGGQNLFDVYKVRSYKVEVESMGNAMIQPMMYFQLNNVPMFHGAYLITKVNHTIEPNQMTTKFTGVRIKAVTSPIIDSETLFMSLLSSLNTEDIIGNPILGTGKVNPVIDSAVSKYSGFITKEIKEIKTGGDKILIFQGSTLGKYLISENVTLLEDIAKEYHKRSVRESFGDTIVITNANRINGNARTNELGEPLSGHREGREIDIQLIGNNKSNKAVSSPESSTYSFEGTLILIQTIIDISKNKIQFIFYNDQKIIDHFAKNKNKDNGVIVKAWDGHFNHIHIQFYIPDRVLSEINSGNTTGDFNPDETGIIATIPPKDIQTEESRKKSLGTL